MASTSRYTNTPDTKPANNPDFEFTNPHATKLMKRKTFLERIKKLSRKLDHSSHDDYDSDDSLDGVTNIAKYNKSKKQQTKKRHNKKPGY